MYMNVEYRWWVLHFGFLQISTGCGVDSFHLDSHSYLDYLQGRLPREDKSLLSRIAVHFSPKNIHFSPNYFLSQLIQFQDLLNKFVHLFNMICAFYRGIVHCHTSLSLSLSLSLLVIINYQQFRTTTRTQVGSTPAHASAAELSRARRPPGAPGPHVLS